MTTIQTKAKFDPDNVPIVGDPDKKTHYYCDPITGGYFMAHDEAVYQAIDDVISTHDMNENIPYEAFLDAFGITDEVLRYTKHKFSIRPPQEWNQEEEVFVRKPSSAWLKFITCLVKHSPVKQLAYDAGVFVIEKNPNWDPSKRKEKTVHIKFI